MIEAKRDISFSTFYITEFFNEVLHKGANLIERPNLDVLEEVSGCLLKEPKFISGLEKLAQYQGTNEFAIFLFDMVERVSDYSPVMLYATLPDLAGDFVNFFNLMMEDKESVDDLETVLKQFKEVERAYQHKEIGLPEISFAEFYAQEAEKRLDEQLTQSFMSDQKAHYWTMVHLLADLQIEHEEEYDPAITDLAKQVHKMLHKDSGKKSAIKMMHNLDKQIKHVMQKIKAFEETNPELFVEIIANNFVPKLIKAPAIIPEEIPEKSLTIDVLLWEYFKTEVDDHLALLRKTLEVAPDETDGQQALSAVIKHFKSLKEISMIHGYNGIEYLCAGIVRSLQTAQRGQASLSSRSLRVFQAVFDELADLQKYAGGGKNEALIETTDKLAHQLLESFAPVKEEKPAVKEAMETIAPLPTPGSEVVEAELAEAPLPVTPNEIPFTDKAALYGILREVFEKVHKRISASHPQFSNPVQQAEIFALLHSFRRSTAFVLPALNVAFFEPMERAYQILSKLPADAYTTALHQIELIWLQAAERISVSFSVENLLAAFEPIWALEKSEELFSLQDDRILARALVETQLSKWIPIKEQFYAALVDDDDAARHTLVDYFVHLHSILRAIRFVDYLEPLDFLLETLANEKRIRFDRALAGEVENTYFLILDRLKANGRSGSCQDIVNVLFDVLQETVPAPVPEKPAPVEEDMEQIFIQEAGEYLAKAKQAILLLKIDLSNRQQFLEIENAVHAIRASANLLNRQEIVDLTVTIEEVAELFGSSTLQITPDLTDRLQQGLDALAELLGNPHADTAPAMKALQDVLDRLVMEAPPEAEFAGIEEAPSRIEAEAEPSVKVPAEAEKPLFIVQDEIDQELLEIFQQESASFIHTLDNANAALLQNLEDARALDEFEYSAHSLKSAAKMLGFREIGQFTDSLEEIVEAVKSGEIRNTIEIQQNISQALGLVKRLSKGDKVSSAELASGLNLLDIKHLKIERYALEKEAAVEAPRGNVREVFASEAAELIGKINYALIELEKMPESASLLTELLRNLHTLKGSAMMVKYEKIGSLAHKLEDYFQFYRQQNSEVKQAMLNPAFSAIDLIYEMIEGIKQGKPEGASQLTLMIAEIDNRLYQFQNFQFDKEATFTTAQPVSIAETAVKRMAEDENMIRLNTAYLDNLVNMATELVVNRTELSTNFEELKKIYTLLDSDKKILHQTDDLLDDILEVQEADKAEVSFDSTLSAKTSDHLKSVVKYVGDMEASINRVSTDLNKLAQKLEKNIARIANLSKTLHSDILKARMVPIETLFNRYPRAVRDLAKAQQKKVSLVMEGSETEMDRAMIEALNDPLMHIIRNAIDHGIERIDERKLLNKEATGTILLRARQDKGQVVIEISDDGRGIDVALVKEKIIAYNLASAEDVAQMSEAEALDYIFYSGFSTRDTASDVSGRGLGLDIVANQIQKLKGIIRIRTEKNIGTTFSIRLPLTLIISQALMTRLHEQNIAIPLMAVQESIEVKKENLLIDDWRKYIQVRGKILPYVTLDEILRFQNMESGAADHSFALILHDAGVSIALGISEITGRQEIVIKSLGGTLQNVEYIAGGTILGNGEVALILDYAALIRTVEAQFFGRISEPRLIKRPLRVVEDNSAIEPVVRHMEPVTQKTISKRTIKDRKPRILIVDDSSSVRTFVSSVLEKRGFATLKASNGAAALKSIQNDIVDLVITDLEMPGMHGFDLIAKVRGESRFKELPLVILTGRTGLPQREKGEALGANAFIGKPFKEGDLLGVVNEFIEIEGKK